MTATAPVGGTPVNLAFDRAHVWVTDRSSDNVSKLEPATGNLVADVAVGTTPRGVWFDGTNIWVENISSDSVSEVIPF